MVDGDVNILTLDGNITALELDGDVATSIGLDGDISNNIELDASIDSNPLSGDVMTSLELEGAVHSEIEIEAEINPVTPSTNDYKRLVNKPKINSIELVDNKSLDDLNIQVKGEYPDEALTNSEIEELLNNFA